MAFPRQQARVPVAVADIEIRLYSPDPTGDETPGVSYEVQVRYDSGEVKVLRGNLVPHLTQAQIDALLNFVALMRTKAETEILP